MIDFMTAWDPELEQGDLVVADGDIVMDATLRTPVIISLGADRLAHADDVLPDGPAGDRRGWWGDAPLDDGSAPDLIGSRLWLLRRGKAQQQTSRQAELRASESLAWMLRDGAAARIEPTAAMRMLNGTERLELAIAISQRDGTRAAAPVFNETWSLTLA